jgi:hypothetical protein
MADPRDHMRTMLAEAQRDFLYDVSAVMFRLGNMAVSLARAVGEMSRDEAIEAMRKYVDEQLSDLHG